MGARLDFSDANPQVAPAQSKSSKYGSFKPLHLHAEQVAQADLRDIVNDVLVVEQISARNVGGSWFHRSVGLQDVSMDRENSGQILVRNGAEKKLTIWIPFSEG